MERFKFNNFCSAACGHIIPSTPHSLYSSLVQKVLRTHGRTDRQSQTPFRFLDWRFKLFCQQPCCWYYRYTLTWCCWCWWHWRCWHRCRCWCWLQRPSGSWRRSPPDCCCLSLSPSHSSTVNCKNIRNLELNQQYLFEFKLQPLQYG